MSLAVSFALSETLQHSTTRALQWQETLPLNLLRRRHCHTRASDSRLQQVNKEMDQTAESL